MTKKQLPPKNNLPRLILFALSTLCFILGGTQIYLSSKIAVHGQELQSFEDKLRENKLEIAHLEKILQETASLSYIEQQAKERLGMKKVENEIVYIMPHRFASAQRVSD